jgi:hypothetical protein
MMNRDLMQRQMFRNGGGVVPMQDGGEPTFRERIEALSKAAGRSIEGLMEPNRDPYENMNPIQDPSAPMNLSPEATGCNEGPSMKYSRAGLLKQK